MGLTALKKRGKVPIDRKKNMKYQTTVAMTDGSRKVFVGNTYPYDCPSMNLFLAENGANIVSIKKV